MIIKGDKLNSRFVIVFNNANNYTEVPYTSGSTLKEYLSVYKHHLYKEYNSMEELAAEHFDVLL